MSIRLESVPAWIADCQRWRGRTLMGEYSHWCFEWDGLPVDETTREFTVCLCYPQTPEVRAHVERLEAEEAAFELARGPHE